MIRYEKVINWISEIWQEFDENIIIQSFDSCGLTTTNPNEYHRQLRHFVENNEFIEDMIDEDPRVNEVDAFIDDESETRSMADESDSEDEDYEDGDDDEDDDSNDDDDDEDDCPRRR